MVRILDALSVEPFAKPLGYLPALLIHWLPNSPEISVRIERVNFKQLCRKFTTLEHNLAADQSVDHELLFSLIHHIPRDGVWSHGSHVILRACELACDAAST